MPTLAVPLDAALPGPQDPVRCGEMGLPYAAAMAYSPDGALLAVAGPRLRMLDTSGWLEVRQFDTSAFPTNLLRRLAFVANGTLLVGVGDDGALGSWHVNDGSFLYGLNYPGHEHRLPHQQVALSDTPLLAMTDGKTVALWDVERQTTTRSMAPSQGQVGALALSTAADVLAMVEGEYRVAQHLVSFAATGITLWDTGRGTRLRTLAVEELSVSAVALSPDSKSLAAVVRQADCQAACDTEVVFYRTSDGQATGHSPRWTSEEYLPSASLSYLPDGQAVAVTTSAGLTIIRTSDGALVNVISAWGNSALSPHGTLAIPGDAIEIRQISDGTIVHLIPAYTGNQAPTFSPDGRLLASVDGNDVVLWRVADGVISARFPGLGKGVQSLAFSPDGKALASGGKDSVVRIWGLEQDTTPLVQRQVEPVTSVVFSPDASLLATGDRSGNIFLRDSKTGSTVNVWYGHSTISALAFSPDGTRLISGGATPGLRMWDSQTGLAVAAASHGAGVVAMALSPDGSRLASAATKANCANPCPPDEGDPEIRIWRVTESSLDLESAIPTVPPDSATPDSEHDRVQAAVWGLAFAPDGQTLLSAGPRNKGHLFRLPEGSEVGAFGSIFVGTPFAVSPDATRIVLGASPIQLWCTAR